LARKPADQSVSREDIIQAAAEVLKRKGFEATTMKDIASEVNLTAASLYHHFANKNALLIAVLEGGMDFAISQIEPIATAVDVSAASRLREMIAVHVISLTEHTAVGAAMVFEIGALVGIRPPAAHNGGKTAIEFLDRRELFFERRDAFERHFRDVVQDGIAAGEFREVDVPIFVKTMLGAHNWVSVWYREGGRLTGEDIAANMADTFLRALAP
jgi:AcrR family transcriptional regulator